MPNAASERAAPSYDVSAIRYATIPGFRVSGLIAGADTSRRLDIAMMVWLLDRPGRRVLVDAGFYRKPLLDRWHPADYLRPDSALAAVGLRPSDITDVIISHVHWDHLGGADLFPNATIWIQRAEYEHHLDATGAPLDRAIDGPEAAMLARLRRDGRVKFAEGDAQEIIPGITVYTGGRHTFASQYAAVRTSAGTVVIASDNMYLYENLERHLPIAQTLDAASNLAAQDRMTRLAASPRLIVPGHDPAVYTRFPVRHPGVAHIE
jgi:glyoxylase-like metal-dependent hydrolase (beta-lactamase superfamily II)